MNKIIATEGFPKGIPTTIRGGATLDFDEREISDWFANSYHEFEKSRALHRWKRIDNIDRSPVLKFLTGNPNYKAAINNILGVDTRSLL
jgi:hypothetical protein